MQAGLDVFAMDSPEHKELKEVERDVNLMEQVRRTHDRWRQRFGHKRNRASGAIGCCHSNSATDLLNSTKPSKRFNSTIQLAFYDKNDNLAAQIWTVSKDWETAWDGWKSGLFTDLDVEEMEAAAGTFTKKVRRTLPIKIEIYNWTKLKAISVFGDRPRATFDRIYVFHWDVHDCLMCYVGMETIDQSSLPPLPAQIVGGEGGKCGEVIVYVAPGVLPTREYFSFYEKIMQC